MNSKGLPYQVRSTERFFDRPDVKEFLKGVRTASVIPTEGINWLDELYKTIEKIINDKIIQNLYISKNDEYNDLNPEEVFNLIFGGRWLKELISNSDLEMEDKITANDIVNEF